MPRPMARRRIMGGWGVTRWVVERTIAWVQSVASAQNPFWAPPGLHEAFLKLGYRLICWRFLKAA